MEQNYSYTFMNNCTGNGECYDGSFYCKVQYSGEYCEDQNLSYFAAFSSAFYTISLVLLIQLLFHVKNEYERMEAPSFVNVMKVTILKAIYLFVAIATSIRGFVYSMEAAAIERTFGLSTAYYPLVLTASSIVVCWWAEIFHVRGICLAKPQFLKKSILGFMTFNIISYLPMSVGLLLQHFNKYVDQDMLTNVLKGYYLFLWLIVIGFLVFYGIKAFFKIRGGFTDGVSAAVNSSQLRQSRFGVISGALLMLVIIGFLMSDTLESCWKHKIPIYLQNVYDITFGIVELGVALWFPCVLWNCVRPEQLWALNPRKLMRSSEEGDFSNEMELENVICQQQKADKNDDNNLLEENELVCWICYDTETTTACPLIQPCLCKGDLSYVHQECLKRWLIESSTTVENMKCKVCKEQYKTECGFVWLHKGCSKHDCFSILSLFFMTCLIFFISLSIIFFTSYKIPGYILASFSFIVAIISVFITLAIIKTVYDRAVGFALKKIVGRR